MINIGGRSYRFKNKRDMIFVASVVGTLVFIVGLQQLIPANKPLPFSRINGSFHTIGSEQEITDEYAKRLDKVISLKAGGQTYNYTIKDLGISLESESTVEQYMPESRLKRLIPFSVLTQVFSYPEPVYTSNKRTLDIATAAIADELNTKAENASITIDQSTVKILEGKEAVIFEPKKATFSILEAINQDLDEVTLKTQTEEPDITTGELESATREFVQKLPENLTINVESNSVTLPVSTMITWVSFIPQNSKPVVRFDESMAQEYADKLADEYSQARKPTATTVSIVDGIEASRINGKPGQNIVASDLVAQMNEAIQNNSSMVSARVSDVPSPIKYVRSYTKSSAGLQQLIDSITDGKSISIRYVDIYDRGWDVGSRHHVMSRMASTYKMFVSYSVLKRIETGSMRFSDNVNGLNIDQCLQKIIIDSNNECAIALAERIGWQTVAAEGRALGATDLDWSKELWGTANDASIIPIKLARGEILTKEHRDYMLDLMQRQRFRSGIPAGTPYTVADKVGFIDGWLNDAAIVYVPDRPYVLVVYTRGESWTVIAEITRQVEALAL